MRILKFLTICLLLISLAPAGAAERTQRMTLILQGPREHAGMLQSLHASLRYGLDLYPELRVYDIDALNKQMPDWLTRPLPADERPQWAGRLKTDLLYLIRLSPYQDSAKQWLVSLEHYDAAVGKSSAEVGLGPLPTGELLPELLERIALRSKVDTRVRSDLRSVLGDFAPGSQALRAASWQARFEGELQEARAKLDQALAKDDHPVLVLERGNLKAMNGDFEGAVADFSQALKPVPTWAEALYLRALAQAMLQNWDEGVKDLKAAYASDPVYHPDLLILLGKHAREQTTNQEALAYFMQAVTMDPDHPAALQLVGRAWVEDNKAAMGLPYIDRGLKASPNAGDRYDLLTIRAIALTMLKRNAESIPDLTIAINLAPDKPLAWYLRGLSWAIQGQCPKARYDWTKACQLGEAKACSMQCR